MLTNITSSLCKIYKASPGLQICHYMVASTNNSVARFIQQKGNNGI